MLGAKKRPEPETISKEGINKMKNAIRAIVDEIPSGRIFDSHFVINRLIKHYSDEYLLFATTINATTDKTLAVHGKIGQEIAKLSDSIVNQLPYQAWSENIHGNPSDCTCWQKR